MSYQSLLHAIDNFDSSIGIIGMGYVGLPLALYLSKHFKVIGFVKEISRILQLKKGLIENEN